MIRKNRNKIVKTFMKERELLFLFIFTIFKRNIKKLRLINIPQASQAHMWLGYICIFILYYVIVI
jgi:hypothetical protein